MAVGLVSITYMSIFKRVKWSSRSGIVTAVRFVSDRSDNLFAECKYLLGILFPAHSGNETVHRTREYGCGNSWNTHRKPKSVALRSVRCVTLINLIE